MACRYDGTVRTGAGAVVQFLYGEDGMDGTSIESQFFNNLKLTPAQMSVGHTLHLDTDRSASLRLLLAGILKTT